jgi:nicotinamide phosphoribosyltransferase
MTPRKSRLEGVDRCVLFGLQYFLKEYLIERMDKEFFGRPKESVIDEYRATMDEYLGPGAVPVDHIGKLHDLGYLPLQIKAMPEGTRCPIGVPMFTIVNTNKDFFWLTNQLETILSCSVWQGCTSATIADRYRSNFDYFNEFTGVDRNFTPFQGHDFSFRGMSSLESAQISAAAHLLSFLGTDTIPAIGFVKKYYGCDGAVGVSVPATEHSVMCMGGDSEEEQIETIRRLITEIYPKGIVSIVADTWDFWWVITKATEKLKNEIMSRDGKVVFRPDSGDPVKILTGDDDAIVGSLERRGAYDVLASQFGTSKTSKGFNQLDSHVGLIYGDSITLDRQVQIMRRQVAHKYATDIVLGIGSYTYQYNTRDTFGFAVKATWGQVNGEGKEIFKSPKTDKGGEKKSAKGLLMVDENLKLHNQCSKNQENSGILREVFYNGKLRNTQTFDEVRAKLNRSN